MAVEIKKLRNPSVLFFAALAAVTLAVALLSHSYFTDRAFYLNQDRYTLQRLQGDLATYRGGSAGPVGVRVSGGGKRTVRIGADDYVIAKTSAPPLPAAYTVAYPNGHRYAVEDNNGMLLSYDAKGELVVDIAAYSGGVRIDEPIETYLPASLVAAAYPDYHRAQGRPGFLFLALAFMIFGWCCFRYERFQTRLFYLSPRQLLYDNPEPSDFYYFMSKAGGIAVMGGSVWVACQAFVSG
ncbi:hypothetical protein I8J29_32405 [Paenibacillus sp. MWE-103]|uniref:DUF6199 domain-containing protein n=1 Tax=Paenibacillus artemisiicola TaxID=1172618 RepID=A0ABS3WL78_9BACL|nr:hypothetical protein [Paenibacillus artemisiicola]MBO7748885.1 hypothetical protein [Paenibacillus artemisiicola]